MTLKEALDLFILDRQIQGVSPKTIISYQDAIGIFLNYAGNDFLLDALTLPYVDNYILGLYSRKLSRASISTYVRSLRIFLRWIYREYDLSFDPAKIKIPKSPKKIVHLYSDDEIKLLFSSVSTSIPWITARNQAMLAIMLDSGIRQCELCGLLRSSLDRKRHVMKVTGKGSKERMVPLGTFVIERIDYYLSLCPYPDSPYVFLGRNGKQISGNAVRLFTNRLQKILPFDLSSHKLRHNFATNFCIDHIKKNGNSDVYDLSILMGHESIETTKRYEHFAHELIAAENNISHLDSIFKEIN